MTKTEWLDALRLELETAGLERDDVADAVAFWSEAIDDRVEDGISDEEAVLSLGDAAEAARSVVEELPVASRMVARASGDNPAARLVTIALLVLGFPLWGSLVLAAGAVLLALFIAIFALAVSAWVVDGSFLLAGIAGVVVLIQGFATGLPWSGLFQFGCGIAMAGVGLLLAPFMAGVTQWAAGIMVMLARKVSSLFVRRPAPPSQEPGKRVQFQCPRPILWVGVTLVVVGAVSALVALSTCGFNPESLPQLPPICLF